MAGFKISGKDNNYVVLAGGGSKALTDFAMSTALSGYLPLSGGTLTGSGFYPLTLASTANNGAGVGMQFSGDSKLGIVLYQPSTWGMAMLNYSTAKGIGILDNGTPYYGWGDNKYTLLHANNYSSYALPLSGGTLNNNAVISRTGTSVGWVNGRKNPIIKTTSYTGYNAILSMKTTNGSWDLGVYSNDTAYLTYITDTNYSASNNATTYLLVFQKKNGTIALTSDIPTKTSQLTNDSGFLTSHQSLANYLPLSGNKEITASFYLKSAGVSIIQKLENTSNYGAPIVWYKGGTSQATYNPLIGHHNTGDTNGSITILPYSTETAPWGGTVGLYIGKNTLKWENKTIIDSGNISSYAITSHQSLANYVTLNGDQTITGAKTFNGTKFILAGNESNEILNIHYNNGLYYKYDDSAVLGSSISIRNALRFRWYNDYWVIGNIRSGNTGTFGFGISLLNSDGSHLLDRFRVNKDGTGYLNGNQIITTANISSYALTSLRIADALGAGGAPITTSVSSARITDSYYVLATTSSGSCAWYKLPSNAFLNDNTNTTYSPGTGLSLDGTTFNAKLATNTLLGVTKYVKYYSAASVKRYNGDVGGSEVDTSTTANIELAYASSTSGRFYPVLVDKNGFTFVNIPWSDTNTTYTFTTSGSGNVLTGVSTSGTTITFTKGNVSSGSTYGVVSNSENGLAPKVISTNTASIGSAYYVLASTNGSASPSWYKLPSTAFSDSNSWRTVLINGTSISNNTLNLISGSNISLSRSGGDVTITASTQFLVVSSLPSGSSITSGVLYLVTT